MSKEQQRLIEAATAWWKMRRPMTWSVEAHLANPTINTSYSWERDLARAVADLVVTAPPHAKEPA